MMLQFEVLRCASGGVSSASVALFTLETPGAELDDMPRVRRMQPGCSSEAFRSGDAAFSYFKHLFQTATLKPVPRSKEGSLEPGFLRALN